MHHKTLVFAIALLAFSVTAFGSHVTVLEQSNGTSADPNEIAWLSPGVSSSSIVFATPYNGPSPYGGSSYVSVPADPGPEIVITDTFNVASLVGFDTGFVDVIFRNYGTVELNGVLIGSTAGNAYPGFPAYTRGNFLFDSDLYMVGENTLKFTAYANEGCGNCNLPIFAANAGLVNPVPEPGTWILMSAGLIGIGLVQRRRSLKH